MNDPIGATCRRDFYPAYHNSGTRALSDIWWIIMHDEEAPNAAGSAHYFQEQSSGGSAHLCVDWSACYRCLPNEAIPWGAISSFGANTHGFHIEQAGYVAWSLGAWELHMGTIKRAAFKAAQHAKLFKIPVQFVTAAELPAKHGITTHYEVTMASKRLDPGNAGAYDHTDPGPHWPRDIFMHLVQSYYKAL